MREDYLSGDEESLSSKIRILRRHWGHWVLRTLLVSLDRGESESLRNCCEKVEMSHLITCFFMALLVWERRLWVISLPMNWARDWKSLSGSCLGISPSDLAGLLTNLEKRGRLVYWWDSPASIPHRGEYLYRRWRFSGIELCWILAQMPDLCRFP